MSLLLIGSEAAYWHGVDLGRRPRDVDLVGTMDHVQDFISGLPDVRECRPFEGGKKYLARTEHHIFEFEVAWPESTAEWLVRLVDEDPDTEIVCSEERVPSLDLLYALKMSHRYLKDSPHFLKTMRDIHLMRAAGARIRDEHLEWYRARVAETYWYKHPALNVMKGDFFRKDEGVTYVYDHDTVHVSMGHVDRLGLLGTPAYTLYMREGAEVDCDREKFFALPEEVRLWGVLEEAQVLALERSQVPFRGKVTPRWSFDKALMKVCTSITSGWFREFAWENYDKVQALYEEDYVDRFWAAVDAGVVREVEK